MGNLVKKKCIDNITDTEGGSLQPSRVRSQLATIFSL